MEYKSVIQNLGKARSGDGGGMEEACKCDEGLEHEVVEGLEDGTGQRNASEGVVAAGVRRVLHRVSPSLIRRPIPQASPLPHLVVRRP
jgi:hypothetical protein